MFNELSYLVNTIYQLTPRCCITDASILISQTEWVEMH